MEYWNVVFNVDWNLIINPMFHFPRTHYFIIPVFHHSNCIAKRSYVLYGSQFSNASRQIGIFNQPFSEFDIFGNDGPHGKLECIAPDRLF